MEKLWSLLPSPRHFTPLENVGSFSSRSVALMILLHAICYLSLTRFMCFLFLRQPTLNLVTSQEAHSLLMASSAVCVPVERQSLPPLHRQCQTPEAHMIFLILESINTQFYILQLQPSPCCTDQDSQFSFSKNLHWSECKSVTHYCSGWLDNIFLQKMQSTQHTAIAIAQYRWVCINDHVAICKELNKYSKSIQFIFECSECLMNIITVILKKLLRTVWWLEACYIIQKISPDRVFFHDCSGLSARWWSSIKPWMASVQLAQKTTFLYIMTWPLQSTQMPLKTVLLGQKLPVQMYFRYLHSWNTFPTPISKSPVLSISKLRDVKLI